jgi:hypothetical protein
VFLNISQDETFHGIEVDLFLALDDLQLWLLRIRLNKIVLWIGFGFNTDFGFVL